MTLSAQLSYKFVLLLTDDSLFYIKTKKPLEKYLIFSLHYYTLLRTEIFKQNLLFLSNSLQNIRRM